MSMTKSQKAAEKLEKAKAEYKEAKQAEAEDARKDARRNFTRAARKAGLLRLVIGGMVTLEALEVEFRAVAERLKPFASATISATAVLAAAAAEQTPAAGTKPESQERKPFWKG